MNLIVIKAYDSIHDQYLCPPEGMLLYKAYDLVNQTMAKIKRDPKHKDDDLYEVLEDLGFIWPMTLTCKEKWGKVVKTQNLKRIQTQPGKQIMDLIILQSDDSQYDQYMCPPENMPISKARDLVDVTVAKTKLDPKNTYADLDKALGALGFAWPTSKTCQETC